MATIALTANTSWYIYNFRRNTILQLIEIGYCVVVVSPTDEYTKKIIALGARHIEIRMNPNGLNPFQDVKTLIEFYRIYKNTNIDVILNFTPKNNIYSTLAAFYSNKKVINNIAGLGTVFTQKNLLSWVVKNLYRISQKKADYIFFQNDDDRNVFLAANIVKFEKTMRVPGSGVDIKRFNFSFSETYSLEFLLIARMLYQKGITYYADAARVLKKKYGDKVRFSLLGFLEPTNPSYVSPEQMDAWIKEGIITYLGVSDSVENEIEKADCIVLPSFYREGVPKSLLEAAAMGKPIITTDNVGCRDIVDDGVNGYLCKPQSLDELVNAMEKVILMSPKQRKDFSIASRKKVEKEFDEKIVINKYLDAINKVLKVE
ncbi:glycosyl transferase family 1 [Klebsiella sp. RIT-PI-d]|uniref:glycosyltransferase family 4 protein n=1 Tax=Klebsiella sp. RIT-PI-d TaxID=1681196 RepID=UPI0006765AA6|nr:glycosyltransferase family 4 protein [Klebsiella sp. RIT-PI-d]KNC09847.1 glycosyl transferase family 1 [Klebsiella sp. RIT-PI-d]